MRVPQMPIQLQAMLKSAFREGDVDAIVHFNKIWNAHVKEVQAELREQAEREVNQNEGSYQYEE